MDGIIEDYQEIVTPALTEYDMRQKALDSALDLRKPEEHVNNLLIRAEKILAFLKGEARTTHKPAPDDDTPL